MADSLTLTQITNATIKSQFPKFNSNKLLNLILKNNKELSFLLAKIAIDTSGAALAETTDPANICLDFTTPKQVYLRSSSALDVGLKIDVIGQKADGSFGQFTLTSDAVDGTTPVDCGTWNFIATVIKNEAFAGNVIIDDDGASSTVYWTAALGATATTGIIVIPDGYNGDIVNGYVTLLADTGADNEGMIFEIGDITKCLNRNLTTDQIKSTLTNIASQTQLSPKNKYITAAVTVSYINLLIAIWK